MKSKLSNIILKSLINKQNILNVSFKYNTIINYSKFNFGGGHHHHISGKVDENKTFMPENLNLNLVSLTGLPSNNKKDFNTTNVFHNNMARNSKISPFDFGNRFNSDLGAVMEEDNPYAHPEPYGYLIPDDVRNYIN